MQLEINCAKEDWFVEFRLNELSYLSLADARKCSIKPNGGDGLTFSFFVKNLVSLYLLLKDKDVSPSKIQTSSTREPYFYVYDPEGNRIEFWTSTLT